MKFGFGKLTSIVLAFLLLTLGLSVQSRNVASVALAQGETVYLPLLGNSTTTPQQQDETFPEQESDNVIDNQISKQENDHLADKAFPELNVDPDAPTMITDDARFQDGDGLGAARPQDLFTKQGDISAAAFNETNWYVKNNLGVGTDSPTHRIEVDDNVNWVNRLLIRNNHAGSEVSSDVYLTTGTAKGLMIQKFGSGFSKFRWAGIPLADYARIRTDTGVKGLIQTTANGPMYFGTGDKERLRIHTNGGMTVRNTNSSFGIRIDAAKRIGLSIDDSHSDGIQILNPGLRGMLIHSPGDDGIEINGAEGDGVEINGTDASGVYISDAGSDGIQIRRAGDDGLWVWGSVGDGMQVENPGGHGVYVHYYNYNSNKDGIRVHKGDIVIDTQGSFIAPGGTLSVPDYVFEDDYPLMSLDELQTFIETEKHLPNVPSEDEIHANGIDLSEFHMRLLEKAEELTLYTLQQEDVIVSQTEVIEALLDKVETLEARIDALESTE